MSDLPVIVIGAGPQGLAAAAHLLERGFEPLVLERGESAGAAVSEWGHVRLFSGWDELVDSASRRLLQSAGHAIARRSLLFVISDFISAPGWEKPLAQLSRRHEVLAVRLYDPLEQDLLAQPVLGDFDWVFHSPDLAGTEESQSGAQSGRRRLCAPIS